MAEIPIWTGNATFNVSQNPTAFGFYDSDTEFQTDAPNVAKWCAQRLGYPLVDIELTDVNFFTAFEEAITEYGAQVYQFQVINNIGNLIGYETGSIHEDGFNQIIISDVYGTTNDRSGNDISSYSTALGDTKVYSASLRVKQGTQKYSLISATPAYASASIVFNKFQNIPHSASIAITDTNGTKIYYRATTGSSAGGHVDGVAIDPDNPPLHDVPNMRTGSGEYRRYVHASASIGEFVTGSYGVTDEFGTLINGTSYGMGDPPVNGSGNNSAWSASFDSFISTLTHPEGKHAKSFTITTSSNDQLTELTVNITQKIEGTGGNTTIELTGMDDSFPQVTKTDFGGGDSGLSFETSGSQIQARSKRIKIEKIYHYAPAAINRYFDPYAGTGTGIQSLMQTFGFGNYSPGVNFMLMPMYFDALKLQAIEMNDKIRKSAYHFELSGRNLRLFPIPTRDYTLWFDYTMADSSNDLTTGAGHSSGDVDDDEEFPRNLITDQSNVPYKNPTYKFINAIGRQWIRKYTLALCKEMLGSIRGKYQSVPIPGDETTLDFSRLLSEAAAEKLALIEQLRSDLDLTTTVSQNERSATESEFAQAALSYDNPYQIYIH